MEISRRTKDRQARPSVAPDQFFSVGELFGRGYGGIARISNFFPVTTGYVLFQCDDIIDIIVVVGVCLVGMVFALAFFSHAALAQGLLFRSQQKQETAIT